MDHVHDRVDINVYSKTNQKEESNTSFENTQTAVLAPPPFQLKIKNKENATSEPAAEENIGQLKSANGEAQDNSSGDALPPNNTGLPNNLKSGVENLSGFSLNEVKVHYNSDQPAQFKAHAYAQGNDIHVASGQEKHLPHEAWHVVQQKQGRVKPTVQLKDKMSINDDSGLEKEADVMGAKAAQMKAYVGEKKVVQNPTLSQPVQLKVNGSKKVGDFVNDPFYQLLTPMGISLFNAYVNRDDKYTIKAFYENTKDEIEEGDYQVWKEVPSNFSHTPPIKAPKAETSEPPKLSKPPAKTTSSSSKIPEAASSESSSDIAKTQEVAPISKGKTEPKAAKEVAKSPKEKASALSTPATSEGSVSETAPANTKGSNPASAVKPSKKKSSAKAKAKSKPKPIPKKPVAKIPDPVPEVEEDLLDMPDYEDGRDLEKSHDEASAHIRAKLLEYTGDFISGGYITCNFTNKENIVSARAAVAELEGFFDNYQKIVSKITSSKKIIDDAFDSEIGYDVDYEDLGNDSAVYDKLFPKSKRNEAELEDGITDFSGRVEIKVDGINDSKAASAKLNKLRGYWASSSLAKGHFTKHKADTGYAKEVDYLAAAVSLTDGSRGGSVVSKQRADGDTLYFDNATGEFCIKRADNDRIRTLFRPANGIAYYNYQ